MDRRDLLKVMGAMATITMLKGTAMSEVTSETVYELRIYHLNEGKLPLILNRFRTKEVAIFKRLGMEEVGYWTPTDEPLANRTLIYMLKHKSRAAATESWAKFKVDPEWVALKAETEKDGTFVIKNESTFMKLTDFSPKV
ncbi:NIPSNAP family containing protein [Granulicella tundricola MP5ACTX9]|uniref:NIPSNAP family containing protein n=2 Tax=Granulicella TaxID=940557 RepID=E8WX75_GRATM|nr:NIPSNAP family containing protein [Granulicella tundricola MP5ACTX9]